ncbi:MFS transporter [Peribacillus frigoritolerans]|nr:MFS transporter [Peribacillus frigoritolerans]
MCPNPLSGWLAKGREKRSKRHCSENIRGSCRHVKRTRDQGENRLSRYVSKWLWKNGYFFVSAFWSLQVIPTFGIGTYIPEILAQFGFANGTREYLGSAVINIVYLVGLLPALYLIEKYGRRPTLIIPFLVSAISLFVLAATSGMNTSFVFILVLFIIYGTFNTAMGAHDWIYPNELFPTHIRGTAMGFITGVTRIASAIGTFFLFRSFWRVMVWQLRYIFVGPCSSLDF